MRTTVTRAGWTAAAAAGVFLVAGCGGTEVSSASTASSPASFGQGAVRADLEKAVVAAGLPEGATEAGYPEAGRRAAGSASAEERRKVAALITRLSPCVVSWEAAPGTDAATGPAESRRRFDAVLSGLEARGWERAQPFTEAPVAENGTHLMATYKKRGWTLHARYSGLRTWSLSTVMVTEDTCFSGVTDEELALVEALSE